MNFFRWRYAIGQACRSREKKISPSSWIASCQHRRDTAVRTRRRRPGRKCAAGGLAHQSGAVVTGKVLLADLDEAPKRLLQNRSSAQPDQSCDTLTVIKTVRAPPPHLRRHVHEQHGSHRSLCLAVALVGPVDGVGLQDPVEILLPAPSNTDTNTLDSLTCSGENVGLLLWPEAAANWETSCHAPRLIKCVMLEPEKPEKVQTKL